MSLDTSCTTVIHSSSELDQYKDQAVKHIKISEQLAVFPDGIFSYADSLEILDLSGNELTELPEEVRLLTALKVLFVSNNQLAEFPTMLAGCENLTMVGFKSNRINHIAEGVLPKNLRWLILTDNVIETLPADIGQLNKLQKLMLAGNQLKALPDTMVNCTSLELLRISANQLEQFPQFLPLLPHLAWLAFAGNPFCSTNKVLPQVPSMKLSSVVLGDILGEGASGIIYEGKCFITQILDESVAIKLFKGDVTSDGYPIDELSAALAMGQHPRLVNVLGTIDDTRQGVLMSLIPPYYFNLGKPPSLETCTRDTFPSNITFDEEQIKKILQQVASVMVHIHHNGFIHGDLYAHNILVSPQAEVLLTDFGAASPIADMDKDNKAAIEQFEIRAFACLIEDLLAHCYKPSMQNNMKNESNTILSDLEELRSLCRARDRSENLNFIKIGEILASF